MKLLWRKKMKKIIFRFPYGLDMDLDSLAKVLRMLCFAVSLQGRTMIIEPTSESTTLEAYFSQKEISKYKKKGIIVSTFS